MPFTTKFLKKEDIAAGTKAFHFEKPEGFSFIAGQYLNWKLIDPKETDEEGTRRFFSITASPHEADLFFTTRMRDTAFKRQIDQLKPGDPIEVYGPSGHLILHEDSNIPAVFLTGGIGVTPCRSIIMDATYKNMPHKIFMFYSNRRPEDTAFLQELLDVQNKNPNFKLIGTMTEMEKSQMPWNGEAGVIDKDMIAKYIGDLKQPNYYIAGPPGMVEAMVKMLVEAGIPYEKINSENFTGY